MKSIFVLLVTMFLLSSAVLAKQVDFKSVATDLSPDDVSELRRVPKSPQDLTRTVSYIGNTLHQSVDNHQGQITDQYVGPGGIRNIVHRNGVVVLDQIVTSHEVKQLVP